MRKLFLFIGCIAAGIALWLGLDVPNRPDRTIDAQNTAVGPAPVAILDPREPDAKPSESNSVMAGKPGAFRDVSVFEGAFNVRVYPSDVFSPREGPIADYYDSLAQAANSGDADAAFELGLALRRCPGIATTGQELDDKLNAMRQTHLVHGPYYLRPRLVEDTNAFIELERQRYEICKGLSNEQVTGYHDWFTLAAELGNYYAQTGAIERTQNNYWQTQGLVPDVQGFDDVVGVMKRLAEAEPEELGQAIRHLFEARAQGSLQALHDFALLFAAGVLRPANGHSATANAYANLRAASEVWHRIWSPGSYNYDENLRRLSNRLSIYELDWAEGQAQAILREENCCVEW